MLLIVGELWLVRGIQGSIISHPAAHLPTHDSYYQYKYKNSPHTLILVLKGNLRGLFDSYPGDSNNKLHLHHIIFNNFIIIRVAIVCAQIKFIRGGTLIGLTYFQLLAKIGRLTLFSSL